jgi:uncharacterized protein
MHLYTGPTTAFVEDATQNRIGQLLSDAFFGHFGYRPAQSEVRSWRNSLRAMADAVELGDLDDNGIVVEWQLPLSSRRIDCMVTGVDEERRKQAVVVELKQWDDAAPSLVDECVAVNYGGRLRDVLHPSAQVKWYRQYLGDTHTAFHDGHVGLSACAYLHNFAHDPSSELFSPRHADYLSLCPLFAGDRVSALAEHLQDLVGAGRGLDVLDDVLAGRYRPHKKLLDHLADVIRQEPAYVLLDEQRVAFNAVLEAVRRGHETGERTVVVIRGGPGTGKSVVALNLMAELAAAGYATHHATGSKAFTENIRKAVGKKAGALFKYFNNYAGALPDTLDVLVCDEAHRIREHSWNRFTPKQARTGMPQVEELLAAARVAVFFIDDLQVVRPGEVGSTALVEQAAVATGASLRDFELEIQFRCGGSDAFVQWIETTLGLRRTPHVLWGGDEAFDFEVVDSPSELEHLIRERAAEGHTARLAAGFCWPWSPPRSDGTLEPDVKVGDWVRPWNAKPEAGRLAPGIPKSNFWASDAGGLEQVGCVYSAQGFEFDYVGVVFGRDLVYRPGQGWVGQREHSRDSVVRREKDVERFADLVKNTYRVLLSRGLKGCYVYFEDGPTRDFFLSRMERRRSAAAAEATRRYEADS